ncbi:hypothetical protein [Bacillus mycoides]|uniref:hypothetical protein n=1 Tax=Bacillus mycoides TaxID=1405 RepID=UPI0012B6891D|nr:hypothetical protein [Bacillus mycoides]
MMKSPFWIKNVGNFVSVHEIALTILTSIRYMKFILAIFKLYRLADKKRQNKKSPLIKK